jgi:hypothetical protein
MSEDGLPIACDLGTLDASERRRERELLAWFRDLPCEARRGEGAVRYAIPADAATLAALGELLAYERRCCPFLEFCLCVTSAERAELEIGGSSAALDLVLAEFGGG